MRRWPPLHPFLIALAPVLTLYAVYFGSYPLPDLFYTAGVFLALAAVVFFPAWLVLGGARRGAIFASLFLVLFFAYGPVLERLVPGEAPPGAAPQALALAATAGALVWLGRRLRHRASELEKPTLILNVFGMAVVLVPAAQIALRLAGTAEPAGGEPRAEVVLPKATRRPDPLPNFYLIVLDRYADAATLRARFGHDNAPFYDFLRARGFYVAERSRSNYLKTAQSLAALLDFTYLDEMTRQLGRDHPDWHPLYHRLRDPAVARFLQAQGYRYVHFGSWWWPTRQSPRADLNVNAYLAPPELALAAQRSPLYPLAAWLRLPLLDMRLQQWRRVRYQLSQARRLTATPEPTFFFLHLLVPHDPYVFDADGSFVSEAVDFRRGEEESYRRQLEWTNREIAALVEHILAVSATPPVIVLMSDEGTFPRRYRDDERDFDWRRATLAELREKTGILHTIYLPCDSAMLYPEISPVNTFRVVFNACFGTHLPLLPDRVFAHTRDDRPYDFFEVTDKLR